jgi:RNA polymerase-binding transcription factor DksA
MKTPRHREDVSAKPPPAIARPATREVELPEPNTPISDRHAHIPSQWSWHYRTLLHLRDRLLRAHAEHARDAAAPVETTGFDPVDSAQEQSERDVLWTELATEDDRLFEVDCALQRIRDGVYGFCEETGHAIPPERLRAIPWTRFCRTVAEEREKKRRRTPHPQD